jgi:hypothetical protein
MRSGSHPPLPARCSPGCSLARPSTSASRDQSSSSCPRESRTVRMLRWAAEPSALCVAPVLPVVLIGSVRAGLHPDSSSGDAWPPSSVPGELQDRSFRRRPTVKKRSLVPAPRSVPSRLGTRLHQSILESRCAGVDMKERTVTLLAWPHARSRLRKRVSGTVRRCRSR